jgi:hypothetical protein
MANGAVLWSMFDGVGVFLCQSLGSNYGFFLVPVVVHRGICLVGIDGWVVVCCHEKGVVEGVDKGTGGKARTS